LRLKEFADGVNVVSFNDVCEYAATIPSCISSCSSYFLPYRGTVLRMTCFLPLPRSNFENRVWTLWTEEMSVAFVLAKQLLLIWKGTMP